MPFALRLMSFRPRPNRHSLWATLVSCPSRWIVLQPLAFAVMMVQSIHSLWAWTHDSSPRLGWTMSTPATPDGVESSRSQASSCLLHFHLGAYSATGEVKRRSVPASEPLTDFTALPATCAYSRLLAWLSHHFGVVSLFSPCSVVSILLWHFI